jgi:hypothetical protein
MTQTIAKPRAGTFVACIHAPDDDVDLVVGKLYRVHKPEKGDPAELLRLIDESGEDYLYAIDWFAPIDVPARVKRALARA